MFLSVSFKTHPRKSNKTMSQYQYFARFFELRKHIASIQHVYDILRRHAEPLINHVVEFNRVLSETVGQIAQQNLLYPMGPCALRDGSEFFVSLFYGFIHISFFRKSESNWRKKQIFAGKSPLFSSHFSLFYKFYTFFIRFSSALLAHRRFFLFTTRRAIR